MIFKYLALIVYKMIVISAQNINKIVVLTEENQEHIPGEIGKALVEIEANFAGIKMDQVPIAVSRENEAKSFEQVCKELHEGVSAVLDLTWTGWEKVRQTSFMSEIPYFRADLTTGTFVSAVDKYLSERKATDAAFIFQNEEELDQTLYYLIGKSIIRVIVLNGLEGNTTERILSMRPSPSYFVIYGNTKNVTSLYNTAVDGNLVTREERWLLVFMDFLYEKFDTTMLQKNTALFTMRKEVCCRLLKQSSECLCNENPKIFELYLKYAVLFIGKLVSELPDDFKVKTAKTCNVEDDGDTAMYPLLYEKVGKITQKMGSDSVVGFDESDYLIYFKNTIDIVMQNKTNKEIQATYTKENGLQKKDNITLHSGRRFFRVGTAEGIPWSYLKRDPKTNEVVKDDEGNDIWEGYCIDLLKVLAESLEFDYEIVPPKDGGFGTRQPDGTWNGMVGDLAMGETDIIIAPLTMTSEREEVIDFVAPYFDQSGISIVIRKPVRKTSLFKFMTVLKLEVWLSIVGALTVTGIMIWFLDKYSPYSAQNNKAMYPYPCREFTLKESFWFALTSFTPQGGGEAPKALSGRTLVAAYWLFVVLMLATFTANLAAFLTVERMKSPVASLEQLARQSRINYTVVNNSDTHEYFLNMKNAEDVLYSVWKDITLNSSSDQSKYRVWDYPIKEQYGHILQAITQTGPVENASVGFQKVIDDEDGRFAFIHDAAQIRYEVSRNCNLTEVGEMFAEQPYAIAVQQGSHLQEDISRKILDLQKDRYFETLSARYWNSSAKGTCPNTDDSEGITLESLGGVFIATLFGLALAMITLAGEIFYYKRKKVSATKPEMMVQAMSKKSVTIGKEFRPAMDKALPRVSYISVFPRNQLY